MSVTDDIRQDAVPVDGSAERPGARLKKAREARGLDLPRVAAELRLSPRMVGLIEADSYRDLPEPAFVRGYMRRYAQLVQLSPDDIASRFDQAYAADNETPPVDARPRNPVQLLGDLARPRLRVGRLLSWLSLLLLLVLAGGVFWSQLERQTAAPQAVVALPPEIDATVRPAERAATPSPLAVSVLTPAPAAGTPAVLPAPASPQSIVAPAATDRLLLVLSAESWVSVRDADGRELAASNFAAGRTLALDGRAPFAVNVGNAPAVMLSINGRAVDLTPHTRGAVATLTVNR